MATDLFCDLDANRLVKSFDSTVPASPSGLFSGDVKTLNLYFLRQTGNSQQPYVSLDKSASSVKFAIGDKVGLPTSGAWTVDGGVSLTYAATAADVQASLRTTQSDSSLVVAGSMAGGFTVTWGAVGAESLVTGDIAALLPECDLTIESRRTGTASVKAQQFIRVRQSPVAFQDTFTDLTSTVTATVSTVAGGSSTVSEVQKIAFDKIPATGTWTATIPQDTRSVTAAVVAGVFTTTANHGFALNQPVVGTGFTAEANWTEGTTYFIKATPTPTTFTIAATSGGAALTTATADAGTGTITTPAQVTDQLDGNATIAEVKAALEALTVVGTGNVYVTGIPGEYYQVSFQSQKKLANFPAMTVDAAGVLAPTGKTGELNLATFQLADLLAEGANTLSLEIQLIEGGINDTIISQDVTVSADLIDAATLSPVTAPVTQFSMKASDQSVTSSTDLVDCTGLTLPVAANSSYLFSMAIHCGGVFSVRTKIIAPSGSTVLGSWNYVLSTNDGFLRASNIPVTTESEITNDADFFYLGQYFTVSTGATAGSVNLQFTQGTSNATASTIKAGSWIKAERVA
jgi:hypothetical protein